MEITKVKSLGNPPLGAHWSYGNLFMQRIGEKTAKELIGDYPLPKMGYETIARVGMNDWNERIILYVQNVSGDYYLACCNETYPAWPHLFKVEIVK